MSSKFYQVIRFLSAGVAVVILNIASLYIFTDLFRIWYLFSSVLSYILGVVVNFALQKYWVFKADSKELIKRQFISYAIVATGYLLANTILMYFFVDLLHINYLFSQVCITLFLSVINYFINRNLIFTSTE